MYQYYWSVLPIRRILFMKSGSSVWHVDLECTNSNNLSKSRPNNTNLPTRKAKNQNCHSVPRVYRQSTGTIIAKRQQYKEEVSGDNGSDIVNL